jgi:hypothetical protein
MRTGAYLVEERLTPDLVGSRGMQVWYRRKVDGDLWAQLLYARRVPTATTKKNIIFAFTDHNIVYAFDAGNLQQGDMKPGDTTGLIWCTKLPLGFDPFHRCGNLLLDPDITKHDVNLKQPIGIISTPVIDLPRGTLFVVYGITKGDLSSAEFHLAKLDIGSGAVLQDKIVEGAVSRSLPFKVQFEASVQRQRAGLLLAPNPLEPGSQTVYVGFGANTDRKEERFNYHGWVMGYDADTLEARGVFCSTPYRQEKGEGGGIWQGGAGLAADEGGNVYFATANGPGSGDPVTGDTPGRPPFLNTSDANPQNHGNSIVKLIPMREMSGGTWQYYFNVQPFSAALDDREHAYEWEHTGPTLNNGLGGNDIDLGAGGVTVIPGSPQVVGGGKTGVLYVLGRNTMTRIQPRIEAFDNLYALDNPPVIFCPSSRTHLADPQDGCRYGGNPALNGGNDPPLLNSWQIGPHLHGAPTYWQVSPDTGYLFLWGEKDYLKRFYHDRPSGLIIEDLTEFGTVRAEGVDPVHPDSWVMPGGLISLSANGTKDGILWITLHGRDRGRIFAVLANNPLPHRREQPLLKLWEQDQTAVRAGWFFSKNNPPTVADGQVFVGTRNGEFWVYGLAGDRPPVQLPLVVAPVARIDPNARIQELLGQLSVHEATAVTAPSRQHPLSLATATGALTYEARLTGQRGIEWVIAGMTAELRDESGIYPNIGHDGIGAVLATVDHGLTWTAPDGTQMTWSVEKSVKAPEAGNARWALFRSVAGGPPNISAGSAARDLPISGALAPIESGNVLGTVTYVQQLGTEGGAPPKTRGRIGDRVDVPFTATYGLYISEADNTSDSSQAK